ncbi:hypothetical protein ACFE04_000067 [Oxalis oulophora]
MCFSTPEEKDRKSRLFARDRNNSSASKSKKSFQLHAQTDLNASRTNDLLSPSNRSLDMLNSMDTRKTITDQISKLFPSEDGLPDVLCLVNTNEHLGLQLVSILQERQYKVMGLSGSSDIRTAVTFLVNKMLKFFNSCPKRPPQLKLLLAGSDSYVNTVLRHYIDQLSLKPPDWISYIKFFVIPLGSGYLGKYLGSVDNVYNSLFITESWRERLENVDHSEIGIRIQRYLQQANSCVQLPIAEAMLTCKEKSSTEESSQIFIPFILDVRLGNAELFTTNNSLETTLDDSSVISPGIIPSALLNTSSPPGNVTDKRIEKPGTPPSSPNINYHITSQYKELFFREMEHFWGLGVEFNDRTTNESPAGKYFRQYFEISIYKGILLSPAGRTNGHDMRAHFKSWPSGRTTKLE